jgi:hypothetical protein
VQGGGLRLAHLPHTLPGNVRYVRAAFGDAILVLAAIGAGAGLLANRPLFIATVPYGVAALLFYSCWGRPDPRYIAGLFLLTPLLALAGFAALSRLDAVPRAGRALAVVLALGLGVLWGPEVLAGGRTVAEAWQRGNWGRASALPLVTAGIAVASILATLVPLLAGAVRQRGRSAVAALLASLLFVIAVARVIPSLERPPVPFQGPRGRADVERARQNIESLVEAGAVVITTTEVGRPAENIDYYTHAHAVYLRDIERWGIAPGVASLIFLRNGRSVYLFFPSTSRRGAEVVDMLRAGFDVERLHRVSAEDAPAFFVASRFGTMPMDLHRVRLRPGTREALERGGARQVGPPAAGAAGR